MRYPTVIVRTCNDLNAMSAEPVLDEELLIGNVQLYLRYGSETLSYRSIDVQFIGKFQINPARNSGTSPYWPNRTP
jgi:hypothetical protein